jgi:SDR family mycofactocin-dependent oxidoreductase
VGLEGKVAFVTGAARGQGRAHAVRMAQDGADVVVSDICAAVATSQIPPATKADLAQTARLVEATGRRVLSRVVDVRDLSALEALAADTIDEFGRIDVVLANAGILSWGRAWELTTEQWRALMEVNLLGTFHTVKVTVPHLISAGRGGAIVLTSSSAALKGVPFVAHYAAAKSGVVGLMRTLANELGEYGIRVNTIHPSGVATAMGDEATGLHELVREHAATVGSIFDAALPKERMEAEDISAVVSFLVSDAARFMTGVQVPIDLGNSVH